MEGFKFYPNKNKNKQNKTMLTLQNVQTDEPATVVSLLNDVQRYKFVSRPDPPLAHQQMYRYSWFLLCK
jgi:hypothetical protein